MKNYKSVQSLLESNRILTIHQLYAYELIKFVLRSVSGLHCEEYLNSIYQYRSPPRTKRVRELSFNCFIEKYTFSKTNSFCRGAKLYNLLVANDIFCQRMLLNRSNFQGFVNKIRDNYILGNWEIVDFIFE